MELLTLSFSFGTKCFSRTSDLVLAEIAPSVEVIRNSLPPYIGNMLNVCMSVLKALTLVSLFVKYLQYSLCKTFSRRKLFFVKM